MENLAQTILDSYRNGVPVIVMCEGGGILHGIETLEDIITTQMSKGCLTIRVNRQAFESTNLPELCETARQAWLARSTN